MDNKVEYSYPSSMRKIHLDPLWRTTKSSLKLPNSSIQIVVFSDFTVIFIFYAFHFYSYVFGSSLCKALWITIVYEKCYTNKIALPF